MNNIHSVLSTSREMQQAAYQVSFDFKQFKDHKDPLLNTDHVISLKMSVFNSMHLM